MKTVMLQIQHCRESKETVEQNIIIIIIIIIIIKFRLEKSVLKVLFSLPSEEHGYQRLPFLMF